MRKQLTGGYILLALMGDRGGYKLGKKAPKNAYYAVFCGKHR